MKIPRVPQGAVSGAGVGVGMSMGNAYYLIPNKPLLGSNRHLGGVSQPQETRKPNLATFGQIIYYISSRILKNHSEESRKDLIT